MKRVDCPFQAIDRVLAELAQLHPQNRLRMVEFRAEAATSEQTVDGTTCRSARWRNGWDAHPCGHSRRVHCVALASNATWEAQDVRLALGFALSGLCCNIGRIMSTLTEYLQAKSEARRVSEE